MLYINIWFGWHCDLSFDNIESIIWASSWENLVLPYANNKGADQPAHPRSLPSTFVVRCLDSIIPLVSMSGISSLYLASVPGAIARSEASSLGMQAAPSSIPTSGTFFRGDLVMKTFLHFSLFRWFKKSSYQLLAKECALSTGKLPRRLAQNNVARLTDRARNDLKCVEGP